MKHCTVIPIKDQKAMYVRGVKSAYRVLNRAMLLMSKVSKCIQGPLIQSNVTHVRGVKSA